jgi:WD40-like Beta Propeller Repeat
MKNTILLLMLSLVLMACPAPKDETLTPDSSIGVPEVGDYFSFDSSIAPDNFKYDIKTNQWEWKFGTNIKLEFTPSAFGRLRFNKNGTYEFLDLKESGTYRQDKTSKKLIFTGFMANSEGFYRIKRGWCNLVISAKAKDGSTLSIVYEKKSDFPQPDVKDPNGNFSGVLVNMLSKKNADYIDVATAKTIKSHNSTGFPVTGNSKFSVAIYKKNFLDSDEIYPIIEIKDEAGNMVKRFEKTWRDSDKWDIGDYWYGMLSPDGTKLALVGQYKRYFVVLDPKYVAPYPMISVIDVKSGNEIYSYTLDKNGNNWGPGWTPNGELLMPRKGGGIILLDATLKNIKTIYTKNVSEARMNQFGQVLFQEGSGIFTMDSNGSNIAPVKDGNGNLNIPKLFDLGWSPDGKSMAFVVEENLNTYNVLLKNTASNEFLYFSDSKGDSFQFYSPFLNWK